MKVKWPLTFVHTCLEVFLNENWTDHYKIELINFSFIYATIN